MILQTSIYVVEKLRLTSRESQILFMMASEKTGKDIAEQLNIAFETVRSHRKNLYCKLDVNTSAGAVRKAFESGYLFFT